MECVAEAAGEREATAELHGVFSVGGELPLREGDERGAGGDGVGGGRSAGQVEERAAVLFEAADSGGCAGGVVIGVEDGRGGAGEGEGSVEGVGIGLVDEDAEGLRADFPGLLFVGVDEVLVDFEVALAVVELLRGAAAAEEESCDVEAGRGGERGLRGVFPGPGGVGFVKEVDADGLGVGGAEVVLADGGVVACVVEDEAAHALIREVVGVGGEGQGKHVGFCGLEVGAGGGDPEALGSGDGLMERGLVAAGVESNGVDDVEFVDVAFFEGEEEVAFGFGDGTAELEAIAALAGWSGDGGEGIGGVEDAVAVRQEKRAVNFGSTGLRVDLDASASIRRRIVFGGKKIGCGDNARDGAFGREGAGVLEAVDGDAGRAGSAAVGCGEDLQLALEIVGIVGELLNVFLGKGVGADAVIGVEADAVVVIADFDVGGDGGEGEMEIEVEGFSRTRVDGEVGGGEAGCVGGEARCGGRDAGEGVVAGGVGGGAGAVFDGDGGVGEGCAGWVEDGSFDAEAVGAVLCSSGGRQQESDEERDHCPGAECGSGLHVDPILGEECDGLQCRLSGIAYDKRHAGGCARGK